MESRKRLVCASAYVCVCVHPRHPPDDKGAGTFIIFRAQCSQTTSVASTLAFFIFIEITERECKHQLMNSHLGAHFARIGQTDPFINRGCARRRFGYSGMGSILHFVSLTSLRWRKRKKKKKKTWRKADRVSGKWAMCQKGKTSSSDRMPSRDDKHLAFFIIVTFTFILTFGFQIRVVLLCLF